LAKKGGLRPGASVNWGEESAKPDLLRPSDWKKGFSGVPAGGDKAPGQKKGSPGIRQTGDSGTAMGLGMEWTRAFFGEAGTSFHFREKGNLTEVALVKK